MGERTVPPVRRLSGRDRRRPQETPGVVGVRTTATSPETRLNVIRVGPRRHRSDLTTNTRKLT